MGRASQATLDEGGGGRRADLLGPHTLNSFLYLAGHTHTSMMSLEFSSRKPSLTYPSTGWVRDLPLHRPGHTRLSGLGPRVSPDTFNGLCRVSVCVLRGGAHLGMMSPDSIPATLPWSLRPSSCPPRWLSSLPQSGPRHPLCLR